MNECDEECEETHKYGNVIMLFIMSDFLPIDATMYYYTIYLCAMPYRHLNVHNTVYEHTYCIHEYNRLLPVARYAYRWLERAGSRARAYNHAITNTHRIRAL